MVSAPFSNEDVRNAVALAMIGRGKPVSRVTTGMLRAYTMRDRAKKALAVFGIVGSTASIERHQAFPAPTATQMRSLNPQFLLTDDELDLALPSVIEYVGEVVALTVPLLRRLTPTQRQQFRAPLEAALHRLDQLDDSIAD